MSNEKIETHLKTLAWPQIFEQTIQQPMTLPSVLTSFGVSVENLAALAQKSIEPNEAYGRKVIFKDHQVEVMIACWSFQAAAQPHNHGSSQGMIWFFKGNFFEQHFQFKKNKLISKNKTEYFIENTVALVYENDIHSCHPETTGISLHIYSPPIHNMKVWDSAKKRTLTVADNCGAWVPSDLKLILNSVDWS